MSRPPRVRRTARRAALVAACAATLFAGACSSDSADQSTTTAKSDATTTSAGRAAENAVTIETPGMSFDVSGTLRPGVATITFTNSAKEAHMMAMAPMKDGVTVDQVSQALEQSEDAVAPLLATSPDQAVYGTPAPVGPGESSTVTSTNLPAGNYVLLCFFTDDSGTPHWKMGMVGSLKVTGDPVTDKPDSDGTITIDDSGTKLPDGFDGHGTFLVTNAGSSPHSISIARLSDGTTLDAFFQHVGQSMSAGTSVDGGGGTFAGGVDELLPGQSAYLTLDLESGHYGYVSSVDANGPDMPPQHGEFDVE